MDPTTQSDATLAKVITQGSSRQTDLTIRHLVDKGMVEDAYRAYGYFRWVDDWLDCEARPRQERQAFVARQLNLVNACYRHEQICGLAPEETMLVNLIAKDHTPNSGLQAYIRNMMNVMAFDADRRERLISTHELDAYTSWLATAVTEALHFFIGHSCTAPKCEARYLAVSGAHITHMLRDAVEDAAAGYYNIPSEVIHAHQIAPRDTHSSAYREWVRERVQEARRCFTIGREYLAHVESLRCRFAGYAYTRRFEVVLDSIERDGYRLRQHYPERKTGGRAIEMLSTAFWMTLFHRPPASQSSIFSIR